MSPIIYRNYFKNYRSAELFYVIFGKTIITMKRFIKNSLAVLLSAVIGFVNGFFGGGGGMLLVPTLEKVLKCPVKNSHATAIAIILPISIASAITYIIGGTFDVFSMGVVSIGCVAGGLVGAILLKKIKSGAITLIFALMMIGVGIKLLF